MSWSDKDYIKLLIGRPESGPDRWLISLRATADYYGWSEKFPEWSPKPVSSDGKYTYFRDTGRKGRMYCESGRKHRISRDPSRRGHTPGLCNQFKVSTSCTMADMSEIAAMTGVDWYWMTSPTGERISREKWAEFWAAVK
jgi:hypothetical protein